MFSSTQDKLRMQVVLIVEPNPGGHRLMYVRVLADRALARGAEVWLALSRSAEQLPAFQAHLASIADRVHLAVGGRELSSISALSVELSADVTIIPDGDWTISALMKNRGWHGRRQLRVLILRSSRPAIGSSWRSVIKWVLMYLCSFAAHVPMVRLVSALETPGGSSSRIQPAAESARIAACGKDVASLRHDWNLDTRYWYIVIGAVSGRRTFLPCVMQPVRVG